MDKKSSPFIFHVPHSSAVIPGEYREHFVLSDEELRLELIRLTDWYTDDLFREVGDLWGRSIRFPVSRLLVDPERFCDDDEEVMSQVGMGVMYTHTSDGAKLRNPQVISKHWRNHLLNRYYHAHHDRLTAGVRERLDRYGTASIIDCHSFPAQPLPYELDQDRDRPDICIGFDSFHAERHLIDMIQHGFENCGYSVKMNAPFSGSIVPGKFYLRDERVKSLMIEINRSLYIDEDTVAKARGYSVVKKNIVDVLGSAISR